jgi:short-subunit dehydrogenase
MPLLDTKIKDMREVFELNMFALLAMTQAFAPSLIKAKGKVINIGSIAGKLAQPFAGSTSTSPVI